MVRKRRNEQPDQGQPTQGQPADAPQRPGPELRYPAYPVAGGTGQSGSPPPVNQRRAFLLPPIILIAIGLLVTIIVGVVIVRAQQFEDRALRVPGVVTDMENDQGSFRPIVTYTLDGREHTFAASVASDPPTYEIGEKVTVLIDPVNRYEVKIAGQGTVVGVIFLAVGIALLLAGIIVLLVTLRSRRPVT